MKKKIHVSFITGSIYDLFHDCNRCSSSFGNLMIQQQKSQQMTQKQLQTMQMQQIQRKHLMIQQKLLHDCMPADEVGALIDKIYGSGKNDTTDEDCKQQKKHGTTDRCPERAGNR